VGHVTRLTDEAKLVDKNAGEIEVIADGGQSCDICHQCFRGRARRFSMIVLEFDRSVIAGAPAITHDEKFATFRKRCAISAHSNRYFGRCH
jgi:hypothetical protein